MQVASLFNTVADCLQPLQHLQRLGLHKGSCNGRYKNDMCTWGPDMGPLQALLDRIDVLGLFNTNMLFVIVRCEVSLPIRSVDCGLWMLGRHPSVHGTHMSHTIHGPNSTSMQGWYKQKTQVGAGAQIAACCRIV